MKKLFAFSLLFTFMLCAVMMASAANNSSEKSSFKLDPGDYSFMKNVKSKADFEPWRDRVIYFYRKMMKIRPDYTPLPLHTEYDETIKVSDHVTRYKIKYSTTDNLRIPAYLFVPDTKEPVPAVIVYHGHGPGKTKAATEQGEGTNENALALYLAEKLGYVVLAPDARSFGEFKIPGKASHIDYFYSLIFENKLYMSKLMEDGYQDIELLKTIKEADMSHLGAAGISMGSWRTINFAALHEEVKAAVDAGLYIPWTYLFSEKHCKCQHIPKLAEKMEMEDLAATIFPRDLMVMWGTEDAYYKMDAEKLIGRTEKIADLLGDRDHFTVTRVPGMGHQFSNPEIASFFVEKLGPGAWPPEK
jgi:dienelactone hydrolase